MEFVHTVGRITFQCRKCEHLLFHDVSSSESAETLVELLKKISNMNCPECGEEPYENWCLFEIKMNKLK